MATLEVEPAPPKKARTPKPPLIGRWFVTLGPEDGWSNTRMPKEWGQIKAEVTPGLFLCVFQKPHEVGIRPNSRTVWRPQQRLKAAAAMDDWLIYDSRAEAWSGLHRSY